MKRKGYDLHRVTGLIVRRLLGTMSGEEQEEYERMMKEPGLFGEAAGITDLSGTALKPDFGAARRRERAYREFRRYAGRKRPSLAGYCLRIASMAILLLAAGGGIYWLSQPTTPVALVQEIAPAQSKAYLFLADGSRVDLSKGADHICVYENNVAVCDSGVIEYDRLSGDGSQDVTYNKICVPRGGEYRLVLSDGTGIWINAETELKYPIRFGSGKREVFLKGEAYFEVKRDTSHPFVVHTSGGIVTVLGTEFNVRDYSDEEGVVTTLVKGKVEYRTERSHVILNPGYQSVDINHEILVQRVHVEEYAGWKDGKYIFFDESLEHLMSYVERTYDVSVFFTNETIKELRFSGDLQRYDRVELFLRYLESVGDVQFSVQDKTITIYKK